MGQNFDDYPDFQQKAMGIQNYEKHCNAQFYSARYSQNTKRCGFVWN